MKQLFESYDKKSINTLPRFLYDGRIHIIQSETEAERAVDFLLHQPILGFDTETRPSFKKGRLNKVALLQVACSDACFLFRLNHMEALPPAVKRLLQDCSVTKVGLSLHDDLRSLSRRGDFTPGTFIELQDEIQKLGIKDNGLQKIYANLFGERISKGQQLSNWEADVLTEPQQRYAATDAWACIRIYEEITRLLKTKEYTIVESEK
jgi:ribonuclease D